MLSVEEEILGGNRLICDFMGNKRNPDNSGLKNWTIEDVGYFNDEQLLYHKSWDWIVAVYNKILATIEGSEKIKHLLKNEQNFVLNFGTKNFFGLFENQLHPMSCWRKLTDFIKWYHQNK